MAGRGTKLNEVSWTWKEEMKRIREMRRDRGMSDLQGWKEVRISQARKLKWMRRRTRMQMGIQGGPTGIVVMLQRCQPQRTTQGLPLGLRVRVARSHQPRVSRV